MRHYHIIFRACDRVFGTHCTDRPFGVDKKTLIKVCFLSLHRALEGFPHTYHVVGDNLSQEMKDFLGKFPNVTFHEIDSEQHDKFSGQSLSLQKFVDIALTLPEDDWVYCCEDDYLHAPHAFEYMDDLIENRQQILDFQPGRYNKYIPKWVGSLSDVPLFIFPPDYPDFYRKDRLRFSLIFLSKYCHWRQIDSTTHTFLAQGKTLKKFLKPLQNSIYPSNDRRFSQYTFGRFSFKNRALCLSPIPGLTTHMTDGVMSPQVDWEAYYKRYLNEMTKAQG